MGDTTRDRPQSARLYAIASTQHGCFTTAQARDLGYGNSLLSYHAGTGSFRRLYQGVYCFRDFPQSAYQGLAAAWLAVGATSAIVSHESALELHQISDVIPRAIHLTVPRSMRNLPRLPGVKIHTTTRGFAPGDVTTREGIRVTSVARTIADAAEAGTGPEQIELAVRQALHAAITTPRRIRAAANGRSTRVQALVERAIGAAGDEVRDG